LDQREGRAISIRVRFRLDRQAGHFIAADRLETTDRDRRTGPRVNPKRRRTAAAGHRFKQGLIDGQRFFRARLAGDGEVVFDGGGNFNLFNVKAANYNYFEGVTFKNTEIAIWAGTQFQSGSVGLTVKHSRFENINLGIFTNFAGSRDYYIADNTFIGRDDPTFLTGWNGAQWKKVDEARGIAFPPKLDSYTAVRLYGGGHVVAYNYVANFHDGIDVETYGDPEGPAPNASAAAGPFYPARRDWRLRPVAIDFYNNYMTNFHDNAFEADGSMHNVRIMRNMMLNSASHPFCNQPDLCGPVYWIRNIFYNPPVRSPGLTS